MTVAFRCCGFAIAIALFLACAEEKREPASSGSDSTAASSDSSAPGAALLVGWYQESEGRATFRLCTTLGSMRVAAEGDAEALHHEYERAAGGRPVIASLSGRVEARADAKSGETSEYLVVERFERVWPQESCEKLGVNTPLDNTYWRLAELNGAPITPQEGQQRETHIILRIDGQVGGFGGCNHLTGRYERDGSLVRFVDLGSTLMACPYSDEEAAFMSALQRVTSFRILGESLDLRNDEGQSIALLRAVYLR